MSKLKCTVTFEWEIDDLANYDARDIQEAARNKQKWIDDGDACILDLMSAVDSEEIKTKIEVVDWPKAKEFSDYKLVEIIEEWKQNA